MRTLCSKANNKLRALATATPYMIDGNTDELFFLPPYTAIGIAI